MYNAMGLYVFAFDDLFPKRWIELNDLDMLKIYHSFLQYSNKCDFLKCLTPMCSLTGARGRYIQHVLPKPAIKGASRFVSV